MATGIPLYYWMTALDRKKTSVCRYWGRLSNICFRPVAAIPLRFRNIPLERLLSAPKAVIGLGLAPAPPDVGHGSKAGG